jgi:hypothetical protein
MLFSSKLGLCGADACCFRQTFSTGRALKVGWEGEHAANRAMRVIGRAGVGLTCSTPCSKAIRFHTRAEKGAYEGCIGLRNLLRHPTSAAVVAPQHLPCCGHALPASTTAPLCCAFESDFSFAPHQRPISEGALPSSAVGAGCDHAIRTAQAVGNEPVAPPGLGANCSPTITLSATVIPSDSGTVIPRDSEESPKCREIPRSAMAPLGMTVRRNILFSMCNERTGEYIPLTRL